MSDDALITTVEATEIDRGPAQIQQLLQTAVDKGIAPESMEKLVALYERLEDRASVKAFNRAFASFRSECPIIRKTKTARVRMKSGGTYSYDYEPLERLLPQLEPVLFRNGFSFWWDQSIDAHQIKATFILQHEDGHRQESHFSCPATTTNPGMSDQQKYASATSYAKRQALVAGLGLATADKDTDGNEANLDRITDSQAADIEAMLTEFRPDDRTRFLKWARVAAVEDIQRGDFASCIAALEKKRNAQ